MTRSDNSKFPHDVIKEALVRLHVRLMFPYLPMISRLSGSVPATKESPLATSKAMAVLKNVIEMGRNILPKNGM